MSAQPFTLPVPVDRLSNTPQPLRLAADAPQRAAIAERFALLSVDRLEADLMVSREGDGARLTGAFDAAVVQSCVVSAEPVPAQVTGDIALRFEPAPQTGGEVELEANALDTLFIEAGAIDLGEAVAQSLLLALDPFPRADDATLERARALLLSEEAAARLAAEAKVQANPFAGPLAGLKRS